MRIMVLRVCSSKNVVSDRIYKLKVVPNFLTNQYCFQTPHTQVRDVYRVSFRRRTRFWGRFHCTRPTEWWKTWLFTSHSCLAFSADQLQSERCYSAVEASVCSVESCGPPTGKRLALSRVRCLLHEPEECSELTQWKRFKGSHSPSESYPWLALGCGPISDHVWRGRP